MKITKQKAQAVADLKVGYTIGHADVAMLNELARIALASLELEHGMIRRFDLDMSNCDSFGQDCGADMVEDLDGEYVLWHEVLPYLYRYDEYTATTATVYVPDAATAIRACIDEFPESVRDIVEECASIAENACRAAMLQSQGNCIKDGWISCSERMPEIRQTVIGWNGYAVRQCVYTRNEYAKTQKGRESRFETLTGI